MGTKAIVVLAPGTGVAQMDFTPPGSAMPGGPWQGVFFQTVLRRHRATSRRQPTAHPRHGVRPATRRLLHAPRPLLRYRGDRIQTLTGLALGPDGLYFTAIYPTRSGTTAVYKTTYDPPRAHPHLLDENTSLPVVLRDSGCLGCHRYDGQGGATGPVLDRDTLLPALEARLGSAAYRRSSEALDALDREPFVSSRAARQEIRDATGSRQLELWIEHHILEPRFDHPDALMPSLQISAARASFIAQELVGGASSPRPSPQVRRRLAALVRRNTLTALLAAAAVGALSGAAAVAVLARWRRRRPPRDS